MSDQHTALEAIIMAVAKEVFPLLLADDKAETERRIKAERRADEAEQKVLELQAKSVKDALTIAGLQVDLDAVNAVAEEADAFLKSKVPVVVPTDSLPADAQ